jgi:hypothetical protein
MKGSHARDATNHSVYYYGWHINGNALYNVKNQKTLNMLLHILRYYAGKDIIFSKIFID